MNPEAQGPDNATAVDGAAHEAGAAAPSQAGIVAVDGVATTAEGPGGQGTPAPEPETPPGASAPATAADPQAEAAAQLVAIYKSLPGVVPALIGGATVAEVQQSLEAAKQQYADIRAQLLAEQGLGVPQGHAGQGGRPVPTDPFEMIKQGVSGVK